MAVVPPHKEEVRSVWDYRWKQLVDMKVPVRTGVDVTVEAIQAFSPDLVVVATGGTPTVPAALKGGEVRTITAWELLSQPETVASGSVVTVVGGGLVGLETADLLAGKGCRVTVLEMMPTVAPELPRNNRTDLLLRLDGYGVKILTEARVERVEGRSLIATVKGESMVIEVGEALIVALGVKPNRAVVPIIEAAGVPYVLVGDSNQPGNFRTAIRDGLLTALSVDMEGDD